MTYRVINLRDIKGMAWEYYQLHKHRDSKILIEDLRHVIMYIEHIIANIGETK